MNKVRFHTTEQPDCDITTFVLSCNRLDLLEKTLTSFFNTRDQETKMVIVDDSGEKGVFESLVEKYGNNCDVICFPKNRGQWWAMDFMVSYCDTDYIFYLEDDWELLKTGYLSKSKEILKKYRDIGTVDISWRTFEWEGLDTYNKELIDNEFYYKKLWRISDYHYHWYGWIGSPNLKRREDLILLGRVEKYYHEIWIDRKFLALGFKSVFLNDKFVEHIGDNRSRAAAFRANEHLTPEDKYPPELQKNRIYPKLDYLQWDTHWRHPTDITLVTALVDLERKDRDFNHYIDGLKKLLETRHPVIVYCEEVYHETIKRLTDNKFITLKTFDKIDIEKYKHFNKIQEIISKEEWINQSDWMKNSVISSPYYIPLTLIKQQMLDESTHYNNSSYYYWIDSGIYNSYGITENINNFYFTKIPKEKFFISSFPYYTDSEIHGYNINGMTLLSGNKPNYVCRATLFGGTKPQIKNMTKLFNEELEKSLDYGYIGTEESIYTILSMKYSNMFYRHNMPNGDIKNFLNTLKN